ncbi:DUF2975 domain-containing protein [Prevotella sp. P6B1]|uniref:DUF2975 domain-containing protein n=1 Tax=Prevotella sp. P6B1 TaxID=1410613 RepID=UPI0009DD75A6|nr:DUF2975 domain-containing protein [Prevotella sp. P6B1]
MKQKLNILCILLLVLMIAGIVMTLIGASDEFHKGWTEGKNGSEPSTLLGTFGILIVFLFFIVYLYTFACFVRFILNINHGEVFSWANVDLLRTVGWCIIVPTVIIFAIMAPNSESLWETGADAIGFITEGVFILIMAEAFAIGLKLKEEQDLTI